MYKIPLVNRAIVPKQKVVDYLLSIEYPSGKGKAAFFLTFGFMKESWEVLAIALQEHAATHDVARLETTPFGKRYVVESHLRTPIGRRPRVRSTWFMETAGNVPHLITAYPLKETDYD